MLHGDSLTKYGGNCSIRTFLPHRSFVDILNCEHSQEWASFRRQVKAGLSHALQDPSVLGAARMLLQAHAGPANGPRLTPVLHSSFHSQCVLDFHAQLTSRLMLPPENGYCHLGFLTALWLNSVSTLSGHADPLDAANAETHMQMAKRLLGKGFCLDFLSDSDWPLRWTDLYGFQQRLPVERAAHPQAGVPILLDRVVDPQGCTFWWKSPRRLDAKQHIQLAVAVGLMMYKSK